MSHACGKDFEMKKSADEKESVSNFPLTQLRTIKEMERPLLTVASAWQNSLTVVRTCL